MVQYLGYEVEAGYLNILLEYVPGGSIASLLEKFGQFDENVIRIYTLQILIGLNYLHDNNVCGPCSDSGTRLLAVPSSCKTRMRVRAYSFRGGALLPHTLAGMRNCTHRSLRARPLCKKANNMVGPMYSMHTLCHFRVKKLTGLSEPLVFQVSLWRMSWMLCV